MVSSVIVCSYFLSSKLGVCMHGNETNHDVLGMRL